MFMFYAYLLKSIEWFCMFSLLYDELVNTQKTCKSKKIKFKLT